MTDFSAITTEALEAEIIAANQAYRNTDSPIMADEAYDQITRELSERNPGHPLLTTVEPEADFGVGKIRHETPMLSTDKCFTDSELASWARRINTAAQEVGANTPALIKVNAKLDGIAGRLSKGVLATRGDGATGNDITYMFARGLSSVSEGEGDGELVMEQAYFDEHLAQEFKHPRNVVAGAVSADTLGPAAQQAMQDGAIRFVRFDTLPFEITNTHDLIADLPAIRDRLLAQCDYPIDGLVLAVEDQAIRDEMGATGHHNNWVTAAKTNTEIAEVVVRGLRWQPGRTGRLTPVVNIEPVTLSGAVISKVTAHHAGAVKEGGIGAGAILSITRSGLVIPKILKVVQPVAEVSLPEFCPACASKLKMTRDFLNCTNTQCEGRLTARLNHFFHTLGTIDLFGPSACEKLVEHGAHTIEQVFQKTEADFMAMEFGPGQAANLVKELREAADRPVDDFLVLASMGVSHLGRGDSKQILKHIPLTDIHQITAEDIEAIPGFGTITATAIADAIPSVIDDLHFVANTLTRIHATPSKANVTESPITGKNIVFTGTMTQGKRPDMIKAAEAMGATSQSSVNKKTDLLVAGEKVGASKMGKARELGVTVLTEQEYLELIAA